MKRRTKITLRTKIYLAIVGILALAGGILYANPFPFASSVPFPTGVAVSTQQLLVTPYCEDAIYAVDCNGAATLFANIPGFGSCREKYMAFVPSQSGPPNNTFAPRDEQTDEARAQEAVGTGDECAGCHERRITRAPETTTASGTGWRWL